jgi:predicted nucleotidyltransferase component of viral defense system
MSFVEKVKKLALKAMFYDDDLMEILVLKGGSAIEMVYHASDRPSIDLDFSMKEDVNIEFLQKKIEKSLVYVFKLENLIPFDIKITPKPKIKSEKAPFYWGGYKVEFKVIQEEEYQKYAFDKNQLNIRSLPVDIKDKRKFKIDISKYEYCNSKSEMIIDDQTVYVYTPEMIIFEKLRAICQQMDEYTINLGISNKTARARDFYDIYILTEKYSIDIRSEENLKLRDLIFKAKEVPLELLQLLPQYKDYHEQDYQSLKDTVSTKIEGYDFYFNYVWEKFCN